METQNVDLSALKINRTENYDSNNNKKKFLIAAAIIVVVAVVLVFTLPTFQSAIEVKTASAVLTKSSEKDAILTASGYVVAQRKAAVASKGMGRLVFLGVVEGDKVRKTQIIARLEDSDIKAQLEQAKANLRLAQADAKDAENQYNRYKKLSASNSVTVAELEGTEARYQRVLAAIDVAKSMVTAAEVSLENTLIRAPFDGTVLTKNADVGEVVAPMAASASSKAAVVTLADMSSLEAEIDVSESNIEKIKINQLCTITLDAYPDKSYEGFVAKVVPTADRSKATVMVKVGFKVYDSRVLPEMSAKVTFLGESSKSEVKQDEKPKLTIPYTAIIARGKQSFVFKIVNEVVVETEITTGESFGSYTEVVSGLKEGEKIVDSPSEKIKNNSKVKILE